MRLQEQVCSIELGRKLKALGVAQRSLYYHTSAPNNIVTSEWYLEHIGRVDIKKTSICSAFTSSELGMMIPEYCETHRGPICWYTGKIESTDGDYFSMEKSEADAKAAYLIHLIENKHTTISKVNNYHLKEQNADTPTT